MGKIHYIGWYIGENEFGRYTGNIPGMLKMRYVANMIKEAGLDVDIVSLASSKCFSFSHIIKQSHGYSVKYPMSFGQKGKLGKLIDSYLKQIQFIYYVVFHVKKTDTILLYHSVAYTNLLRKLRRYLKRRVALEVEEVYGYSAQADRDWVNGELDGIKSMDYFLFVNSGIPRYLNIQKEDYVVSYGVGNMSSRTTERFNDGKIHIVYAGTIEQKKLGAFTAVDTARLLPDKYVMHILGFGKDDSIAVMNDKISENNTAGKCKIIYEGYKTGKELDDFLFKCHIGISTNVMRPNFANNSFPSKVITYMCHDLTVVLGYADAFKDAPFVDGWTFYYDHTPESIAAAIENASLVNEGFYRPMIKQMNEDLKQFLVKVSK